MSGLGGVLERSVMDVLWSAGRPLRVREVVARLNEGSAKPLAYNTVQTVAERLARKGMAVRTPDANAFRYSPARERDEHVVALMMEALTLSQDHTAVLLKLAETVDASDARQVLDALRRRVDQDPIAEN